MDITTVSCDTSTRERLAAFRDAKGFANYDAALSALLEEVGAET